MKLRAVGGWMLCLHLLGCAAEVVDGEGEEVGVTGLALAFEQEYLLLDRQGRALTKPSGSNTPTMTTPSTSSVSSRAFTVRKNSGAGSSLADGQVIRLFHGAASDDDFLRYGAQGVPLSLGVAGAHTNWTIDEVGAGAGSRIEVGDVFRLSTAVDSPTLNLRSVNGGLVADTSSDAATRELRLGCYFPRGGFTANWAVRPTFTAVGDPASGFSMSKAVNWLVRHMVTYDLPTGPGILVAWDDFSFSPARHVAFTMTDSLWSVHAITPYDSLGLASAMKSNLIRLGRNGDGLRETLFRGLTETRHLQVDDDLVHGELLGTCAGTDIYGAEQTSEVRAMSYALDLVAGQNMPRLFTDRAVYEALNRLWMNDRAGAVSRMRAVVTPNDGDPMFWDTTKNELVDEASAADFNNGGTYTGSPFKIALVLYAARILSADAIISNAVRNEMRERLKEAQFVGGDDDGGVAHVVVYDANGNFVSKTPPTAESTAAAILAHTVNAFP